MFIISKGERIEVASCMQYLCILRKASKIAPGNADLVIIIDGETLRMPVIIESCAADLSEEVRFKLAA